MFNLYVSFSYLYHFACFARKPDSDSFSYKQSLNHQYVNEFYLLLTIWLPIGVTFTPVGVTMVGVTTLMAEVEGVVVVPVIFCVAAAAAAKAWIPDI